MTSDVLVVGGGLVGSAVAYELSQRGLSVVLVDRQDRGQASAAGAGILSPATSLWGSEEQASFGRSAAQHYGGLISTIEEDGGGPTGYASAPVMAVAEDEEGDSRLEQLLAQARGLATSLEEVSGPEASTFFPLLGKVGRAVLDRQGARVDGRLLTAALQRAARGRGTRVLEGSVDEVRLSGQRVVGARAHSQRIDAGAVVLAAGAWLSALQAPLGLEPLVYPMRGQIAHLRWDEGPTDGWAVVVAQSGYYLMPWPDGRVVVGATREADSGLVPELTAGGMAETLAAGLRLAPDLHRARVAEWRVGLRPASTDGLPILGAFPGLERCYLATGHGAGGLLLGPYSARVLAETILSGDDSLIPASHNARRFADRDSRPGPS
jgi:D-amino-acid dehydrogenase